MSSTRPPLTRTATSPGALYGCRDRTLPSPDDYGSAASPIQSSGMNSYFPPHMVPRSSPPSNPGLPIVSIRGSRSPTEDQRAQPDIQVSQSAYSLVADIGRGFSPECITISAKKGNALVIVADRWDMEKDCRYEWVWRFDRDADMSSVHANYDSGVLRVTVRRIPGYRLGNF
ncbi:hypothetical protein B0J17DRAFT_286903 [Rhizoctonia solani]|nr:hypothetical protein B0J17DRAFT_286903 [Rhizoctonia solani]